MELILAVLFAFLVLWLLGKILVKAGFDPLWAFAMLVPVLNVIMVWAFAFADWPKELPKSDKKLRSKGNIFISFLIWFFIWFFPGYFILFACNGGAGGSSTVSLFAWECLGVYTLIVISLLIFWMTIKQLNKPSGD